MGKGAGRRREKFEWRKVSGGYDLVRVTLDGGGGQGSSQGADPGPSEVVASLTWPTGLAWVKNAFVLEFKGSGLEGFLGDWWALMVIITAARIWALRVNGKTTKGFVAVAETVRAK